MSIQMRRREREKRHREQDVSTHWLDVPPRNHTDSQDKHHEHGQHRSSERDREKSRNEPENRSYDRKSSDKARDRGRERDHEYRHREQSSRSHRETRDSRDQKQRRCLSFCLLFINVEECCWVADVLIFTVCPHIYRTTLSISDLDHEIDLSPNLTTHQGHLGNRVS